MRVRPWPTRPFKLAKLGVVALCFLGVALLSPSKPEGAPIQGSPDPSAKAGGTVVNKQSRAEQTRAFAGYGNLPLGFEANQGQADSQVRFSSHGRGYSIFLTPDSAVLALQGRQTPKPAGKAIGSKPAFENQKLASAMLRMRLVGGNAAAGMMGTDELPGKSNYFIGNNPAKWHTHIPNYRRVAEHGVYPGVDLFYYGTQRQLEYDFVIAPGADPRVIKLAFEGADRLKIDLQGNLVARVAGGEVAFRQPFAYQEAADGSKQPVAARYSMKGRRSVAFAVGKYDATRSLIIDPTLAYSTYLGGSSIDAANAIAVAPDNSAFITGETFSSTNFPTVDALFPASAATAGEVAFVSKISPDGSALLYSTYLGCNYTQGFGIAVDTLGEAYVTGTTDCPSYPATLGSFDTLCGADGKCGASWNPQGFIIENGFVTKLNVEGTGLVYSAFFGNYANAQGLAIAVDAAQNAYVTGAIGRNIVETTPLTYPETPPPPFPIVNGFETTLGNNGFIYGGTGTDAVIIKVDEAGSQILYSSYIGGAGEDVGYGVAVDSSANAYVTGVTYSSDFPTSAGALQTSYAGAGDAFLTKINTDATGAASLVYSTYIGGSGLDQGNGVAVDVSGNAFVAGLTTSPASSLLFTPPSGAYQTNCALDSLGICEGDAFIAKFALSSTPSLSYFTYLGGSLADSATGIALDPNDDAYVTGSTVSTNFPIVGAVFQPAYGGGNADAFVTELNPTGTGLVYSTYLGGSATDTGNGIALNASAPSACTVSGGETVCNTFVAGQTCSFDFPLANALQPAYGGNCDAFISKISILVGIALNPSGLQFPTQSLGTTSPAQTVTLTNGDDTQTITGISISGPNAGDFAETSTCSGTLLPGAQCSISVTFTPQAAGIRKASIMITDSAPGSPQSISLTGSTSTVSLSTSSLAFGNQTVGQTSSSQAVALTNDGTTALTISTISASSAFAQVNNCTTAPLPPTTNCVINVTFTPTAPGASLGALTIIDNAPGSPQVVLLSGTGAPAPVAALSANTLTFPNEGMGVTSAPQMMTLTNLGGAPLNIIGIATTGDFVQTNTCGASVTAGITCSISVTFTPTAAGNRYGTVVVTDNAANSPQTVTLEGIGLATPVVSLSVSSLTFASQSLGTTSAPQGVTLNNTGAAPLTIKSIVTTGDFAETNTCGSSLPAGANCTINVTFTPTATGSRTGSLVITDNAAGSPQTVSLGGSAADFSVAISPTSASVIAGNSMAYTLTVTPEFGFSAAVTLGCSGAPQDATCTVSPGSVTPNGTAVSATVTVKTGQRSLVPPGSGPKLNLPRLLTPVRPVWFLWLLLLVTFLASQAMDRRRRALSRLVLIVGLMLLWAACGAGGSQVGVPSGTPAGNYTLTMSATSGPVTHNVTANLTVQ